MTEQTSASTWRAVAGGPIMDELLEWPPDVFALTNLVLGRSKALRIALALAPIGSGRPAAIPTGRMPWPQRRVGGGPESRICATRDLTS